MENNIASVISQLILLQSKDAELAAFKKEAAEIPAIIETLRATIAEIKQEFESGRSTHKKNLLRKKELEVELQTREAAAKKHELELNQIKSNEAYKALQSEIQHEKQAASKIEDEILACFEAIDISSKEEKRLEELANKREGEVLKEITVRENFKKSLDEKIAALEKARTEFAASIDPAGLARYEQVKSRRSEPAIAQVREAPGHATVCSACSMSLTSQNTSALRKKNTLTICDNCQRIIYSKDMLS